MLVHNLAGMCGIVGILRLDRRETPDGARLKRMRDMLRHRGPDGGGLWIDGPVGLGHGCLSIVDVAGGHQPMSNEDGAVRIHLQRGDLQPRRPAAPARGQRALLPDAERYRDDPAPVRGGLSAPTPASLPPRGAESGMSETLSPSLIAVYFVERSV